MFVGYWVPRQVYRLYWTERQESLFNGILLDFEVDAANINSVKNVAC